jgi:hypothetical protein
MKRIQIIGMFAILVALASSLFNAIAKPESNAGEKVYPVIYNVPDMPVWENTKSKPMFAPRVLTALIRAKVDPPSWNRAAEIRVLADKAGLVIAQTRANHEQIADLLESLRESDPREFSERLSR